MDNNSELIGTVKNKPYKQALVVVAIGIAILFGRSWAYYLVGACVIAIGGYILFFVPNHTVLEVYQDRIVIFPEEGPQQIMIDDISEWNVDERDISLFTFVTNDGKHITYNINLMQQAANLLLKVMGDKESKKKERIELQKALGPTPKLKERVEVIKMHFSKNRKKDNQ